MGECLLPVPFFIEEEDGDVSYKARHITDHFFPFSSDFFGPTKLSIELTFHEWYHQGTSQQCQYQSIKGCLGAVR